MISVTIQETLYIMEEGLNKHLKLHHVAQLVTIRVYQGQSLAQ